MMNTLFGKIFIVGAFFCSTQLAAQKVNDKQPWSVRMVESEMIRCPESWQLDFQPKLKWDYCHGLELQAMLDVYDAYGDQRYLTMRWPTRTRWCTRMGALRLTNYMSIT